MNLKKKQINSIKSIICQNNQIFNLNIMIKICKPIHFVSFILKEILEFITFISADGIMVTDLKDTEIKLVKLKENKKKIVNILEVNKN